MSDRTPPRGRRISSTEIAEKMGVSLNTVYVYRSADRNKPRGPERFPDPVGFEGRTVLFDESAIDAYIRARSEKSTGLQGRPPRTTSRPTGPDAPFADRLREAVRAGAGAPDITTLKKLADVLGLNTVTLGQRMRGRTTWRAAELELIEKLLDVRTTDANLQIAHRRAQRRAQRKEQA